jgi:hypothetical protein
VIARLADITSSGTQIKLLNVMAAASHCHTMGTPRAGSLKAHEMTRPGDAEAGKSRMVMLCGDARMLAAKPAIAQAGQPEAARRSYVRFGHRDTTRPRCPARARHPRTPQQRRSITTPWASQPDPGHASSSWRHKD